MVTLEDENWFFYAIPQQEVITKEFRRQFDSGSAYRIQMSSLYSFKNQITVRSKLFQPAHCQEL
jgi:hypothetical protein